MISGIEQNLTEGKVAKVVRANIHRLVVSARCNNHEWERETLDFNMALCKMERNNSRLPSCQSIIYMHRDL